MQIGSVHTVGDIARFLGREVVGNPELIVTGINDFHRVQKGDLLLVDDPKNYEKALNSAANFFILDKVIPCPEDKALIISPEPFDDYNRLTRKFMPFVPHKTMTGENCFIADTAHLSPNCFIGNDVIIGEHVIIYPGAFIGDRTVLEENVIIGPNSVIGQTAFYHKKQSTEYKRLHTCGYVYIEKDVEIGATCTIEAGVSSITRIGEGTKLNNLIQIGHDTEIGKHCLVEANVNVGTFAMIEDEVVLKSQVGIESAIRIGKGIIVSSQTKVSKNLHS